MADAMDSKSISRKGVGVQVPASAPGLSDPLARAMLPVLLHRIGNASQLLSNLAALLDVRAGALEERAEDLAAAGGIVDETGWLLALLASASGANLLLERREAHGLAPLVDGVRACLRRENRDLAPFRGSLPLLAPHVGSGWELPWYVGSVLYLSGRALPEKQSLAWSIARGEGTWRIACARTTEERPRCAIAGASDRVEGELRVLELPAGWLA